MTTSDQYTIDGQVFKVLVNDENQYSIWPAKKQIPEGWSAMSFIGSKAECSEFIDQTWTDMRPKSLRDQMEAATDR
jgi:MbtH protein